MNFLAKILIFPREGVLDTQGKAVARSLRGIGFENLRDVRVGKYIQVWLEAADASEAASLAESMCTELLVNNLIEDHSIEIERCGQ